MESSSGPGPEQLPGEISHRPAVQLLAILRMVGGAESGKGIQGTIEGWEETPANQEER